ncbi:hypothetical protein GRI97_17500 [Altererythrobacter xixiisoli]|uniref:Uncharacterized protein n=1 Tax=Croceibacterium xixiisoli TaxID=1476466 RepID=A0A6I4U0C1_9SPHN|nr:hypothetical protein [Croceibacterium xixiisoli]MXP00790.1 hypothetical protein [Croceibacterium xixiisoli]
MSFTPTKPFLIAEDEHGQVRLTLRETRYNSQGYPWIVSTVVDESFGTVAAARKHAVEHFGAKAGEFASK